MEAIDLYSPQIRVCAGAYTFTQGVRFELRSSRESYFDWAKIRFTEEYQPKINLTRGDPASIELGYNGVYDEVFTGYVSQPYNAAGAADEINLKDDMLRLEETRINYTFLDTTPQEMIAFFLSQAGVSDSSLSDTLYPERRQVPIREMSAVQAIHAVHAAWGVRPRFFFSGGVFYWGMKPVQQKVYSFEYGVNILSLTRRGGVWEIETVSAPFVRHSHRIQIVHPKVSGLFEVGRVVFLTNEDGFIRTYIDFQEESADA